MWFRMKINIIWNWKSGNLMKITFFFFVSTLRRCPLGKLMGLWVRQAIAAFSSSKTTKPKLGTLFWLSVRFLLWATPLLLMRTSTTWNNKQKNRQITIKHNKTHRLLTRFCFQKPGIHRIFMWFRMKIVIIWTLKKVRQIHDVWKSLKKSHLHNVNKVSRFFGK